MQCSRFVLVMELLFSEELGLVLEVSQLHVETVRQRYSDAGVQCHRVGKTCGFGPEAVVRHQNLNMYLVCFHIICGELFLLDSLVVQVSVRVDGQEVLKESLPNLRALWEDTSFQLERLQANEVCVKQEEDGLAKRTQPYFKLTFDPSEIPSFSEPSKTERRRIKCILKAAVLPFVLSYTFYILQICHANLNVCLTNIK